MAGLSDYLVSVGNGGPLLVSGVNAMPANLMPLYREMQDLRGRSVSGLGEWIDKQARLHELARMIQRNEAPDGAVVGTGYRDEYRPTTIGGVRG